MSSLSFAAPAYLGLLLITPALIYLLIRRERSRSALLQHFSDPSLLDQSSHRLGPREVTRDVFRVGGVALLLLALARPQLGERPSAMGRSGRDLLVVLDLSRSMNAADDGLSRLTVAKQLVVDVLATSPGHRVGLVVFGGSAFLQLPLTSNYAAFRRFLDAATTDDLGDPATDLSNALTAAATAFEHEGERGYQTVLLLSDGEGGPGDPGPALTRLRRAGIPVVAVGTGSAEGAPIPADSSEAPEQWHRDNVGRVVLSRLEEGDLRRAARETNGSYFRWSDGTARILASELARLDRRTLRSAEGVERVDRFQWPLGLAIGLLVLAPFGSARSSRSRR